MFDKSDPGISMDDYFKEYTMTCNLIAILNKIIEDGEGEITIRRSGQSDEDCGVFYSWSSIWHSSSVNTLGASDSDISLMLSKLLYKREKILKCMEEIERNNNASTD